MRDPQPSLLDPAAVGVHDPAHVPDAVDWDAYYTPLAFARALTAILPIRDGDTVLEPSVGSGAWLQAVREHQPHAALRAMDIDPTAPGMNLGDELLEWRRVGDFLDWTPRHWTARPHWVVGNPPYRGAEQHIEHALRVVRTGGSVAMLLGIGILAGQGRFASIYKIHRPRLVVVLPQRIAFQGRARDGSILDGRSTGSRDNLFVWWELGWTGPTITAWLDPETMTVVGA